MNTRPKIVYTKTDEAPALATRSLLPLIEPFLSEAGIEVELKDISLAGRILTAFSDTLDEGQRVPDALAELGDLVHRSEANIIKLPNISASVTQIIAAVKELQEKGYPLPDYPAEPKSPEEKDARARYDHVKGSAVNPVIRMGNSDRRVPSAVKQHARTHPHSMGEWSGESRSHVAGMQRGDFYGSEKSVTLQEETGARIEFEGADGSTEVLKDSLPLREREVLDAAVMSAAELRSFIRRQLDDAQSKGVLFSVHLKATMMKVSDPIIFGHVVSVYFEEVFEKHRDTFEELGIRADTGVNGILAGISGLPEEKRKEIEADIEAVYSRRPDLAMVNSDRGITNLHVPSDVIIDASMPAAIRAGGKMWSPRNSLEDMKAVIPDRSYAGIYQEVIDFCTQHGAFDPRTMGSVSNVGLMAEKAEEYGSHDKTFRIPKAGTVRITAPGGAVLLEQAVEEGDIFRACQAKDEPIRDWVGLAVKRAAETGAPAVFWLDENRAHDAELIKKVKTYLSELDTVGLDIRIMSPNEAMRFSLERMREGKDSISVTGNVLRDYLTDLFPILEVGTSAKMLSIVPLMNGGGLFETGAGGSAPKHVQQFVQEGHLRWDSLGEFLALAASLRHLAESYENPKAQLLAETLEKATADFLEANKSPSRKVGEIDNRGSHYYLTAYWARALATGSTTAASDSLARQGAAASGGDDREQKELSKREELSDLKGLPELKERFAALADELEAKEAEIASELLAAQGEPVDTGGYYAPEDGKADAAMRPSPTLNEIIARFSAG